MKHVGRSKNRFLDFESDGLPLEYQNQSRVKIERVRLIDMEEY